MRGVAVWRNACWTVLAFASSAACNRTTEDNTPSLSTGGAPGVLCADGSVCDPGQGCCVRLVAGAPSSCDNTCDQGSPHACDGPEDCDGSACCGDLVTGVSCGSAPECAPGAPQHCHIDSDCPPTQRCLSITVAGVPANECIEN